MARKSRTQPKQSTDTLKALSKVYKTAIYVRLSAEKDETRDRKTLINQRNLIKNFVDQQMDMEVYDIYMDDEISGTTFDRPEFERIKMSGMFLKIIILHLLQRNSSMRYRRIKER